jgi:glycosyltransferase involved in cell wall biosynthesis
MRIAILHLGFFYSGGGEKLILEEIRGLRSLGHEADCFAPYVDKQDCFPDYPEMSEIKSLLPSPPRWLPMKDPIWVALSCILMPFLSWRFRSYDVLLGANQPGPWLAFVVSRILGIPYVAYLAQPLRLFHPRNVDKQNGIRIREGDAKFISLLTHLGGKFIEWADRKSVDNAAIVLTNGDHVSHWITSVYDVENRICCAGCHPAKENQLNYPPRWEGNLIVNGVRVDKPYLLVTNRHSPMKRFEYAIWAFKALVRDHPELSLVITGQETEYTELLKYLVDGLRLAPTVKFVGLVSEQSLHDLYANAALYVYPSPEEDFGMGIVEAMASGTPVVAWGNGGPTVTVSDNETGFLISPYDTEEFMEKLRLLISNPELVETMGRAAHRRASKYFSYARHNQLLERALADAVQVPMHDKATEEYVAFAREWIDE